MTSSTFDWRGSVTRDEETGRLILRSDKQAIAELLSQFASDEETSHLLATQFGVLATDARAALSYACELAAYYQLNPDNPADIEGIAQCFYGYQDAVLADDGERAASFVDGGVYDYYTVGARQAVTLPKVEFDTLSLQERYLILLLRHSMSLEQLENMTGRELFVHAIRNGWTGKSGMAAQELRDVSIDNDRAEASILVNGRFFGHKYYFLRDTGGWKLNLLSVYQLVEKSFAALAEKSGVGEDVFLLNTLKGARGEGCTEALFEPLRVQDNVTRSGGAV